MSFGFTFADDELDDEIQDVIGGVGGVSFESATGGETADERDEEQKQGWSTRVRGKRWSLPELLPSLPSRISYSLLRVPLDDGRATTIRRRDLFDARFQMLVDGDDEEEEEEDAGSDAATEKGQPRGQAQAPAQGDSHRRAEKQEAEVKDSDLVPGVYEGGLKTWECSLDVVRELDKRFGGAEATWQELRGKKVVELGCGTAVPSIYLFRKLLELPPRSEPRTQLHLCDFNIEVLRLVTLPNLFISYAFSAASPLSPSSAPDEEAAGELDLTSSLLESFTSALEERGIDVVFSSGAWEALEAQPGGYDVILSSETIYNLDTLPSLLALLRRSIRPSPAPQQPAATPRGTLPLTLIAAKILYFGVGGGVSHFVDVWTSSSRDKPWCATVREVREGVGRVVLQIGLEADGPA